MLPQNIEDTYNATDITLLLPAHQNILVILNVNENMNLITTLDNALE